jgi:uncharacterized membrane protein
METIEKSIEIDRPLRVVYNQWTEFEQFPRFMEGVKSVQQLDDKRLQWEAEIAGKTKTWQAEIYEQEPDKRIAWRSTSGALNSGRVDFLPLSADRTRVSLRLSYEPEGAIEKIGDAAGLVSVRVSGDLKRFKEFIEQDSSRPEGWRGEIHGGQVQADRSVASHP